MTFRDAQCSEDPQNLRLAGMAVLRRYSEVIRLGKYDFHRVRQLDRLHPEEEELLFAMLIHVTTEIFGLDTGPYWRGRPTFFRKLDEFWALDSDGGFAGWCAASVFRTLDGPYLYVDTLNFLPSVQRQGVGALVALHVWWTLSRAHRHVLPLSCRTQTPGVFWLFHQISPEHTYPPLVNGGVSPGFASALRIAEDTARRMNPGASFERDGFIVRGDGTAGRYGRPIVDYVGEAIVDPVEYHFSKRIDIARGDAVIVVIHRTFAEKIRHIAGFAAVQLVLKLGLEMRVQQIFTGLGRWDRTKPRDSNV